MSTESCSVCRVTHGVLIRATHMFLYLSFAGQINSPLGLTMVLVLILQTLLQTLPNTLHWTRKFAVTSTIERAAASEIVSL